MQTVFVVGTGRCGSTLLTRMLHEHPAVLSLSEFFRSLSPTAFPRGQIDGCEFWEILSAPRLKTTTLIKHGLSISEFLYLNASGRRYSTETGIPALLLVTLPFISTDPDRLFDDLQDEVCTWHRARVETHYTALFRRLATRSESVAVERSGGSVAMVSELARRFPAAKFVHLTRNGFDTAKSMSRHNSFRLAVLVEEVRRHIGIDPFHSDDRSKAINLPAKLHGVLPENFDPCVITDTSIPLATFGQLWSTQIVDGLRQLAHLPIEQVCTVSYEALVSDPVPVLDKIATFALPDSDAEWKTRAARLVRPTANLHNQTPEPQADELAAAVRLGMRLLGRSITRVP